jgi:hypothetical protein
MIKNNNVPYDSLTKESIVNMIVSSGKKKLEFNLLNKKKERNVKAKKCRPIEGSIYILIEGVRRLDNNRTDRNSIRNLEQDRSFNIIIEKRFLNMDIKTPLEIKADCEKEYDLIRPVSPISNGLPLSTKNYFNIVFPVFNENRSPLVEKNINMQNKILIHEPTDSHTKGKKSLSIDMEVVNKDTFDTLYKRLLFPTPLQRDFIENFNMIPFSPALLNLSPKSAFSIRK